MKLDNLNWKPHPAGFGTLARMFYPNGYGASILLGSMFYSDGISTYEVGVLKGNEKEWGLTYDTPITNDVLGYLTEEEVLKTLNEIGKLPNG